MTKATTSPPAQRVFSTVLHESRPQRTLPKATSAARKAIATPITTYSGSDGIGSNQVNIRHLPPCCSHCLSLSCTAVLPRL